MRVRQVHRSTQIGKNVKPTSRTLSNEETGVFMPLVLLSRNHPWVCRPRERIVPLYPRHAIPGGEARPDRPTRSSQTIRSVRLAGALLCFMFSTLFWRIGD